MNSGLRVIREVTGIPDFVLNSLASEKDVMGTPLLMEYDDGSRWVDNDHPWDAEVAREITKSGGRFAVIDEGGNAVAGPYRALDKAEKARASAKMTVFAVDVDEADEPEAEQTATDEVAPNV